MGADAAAGARFAAAAFRGRRSSVSEGNVAAALGAMGASKAEILAVLPVFRRFRTHISPPYYWLQQEY